MSGLHDDLVALRSARDLAMRREWSRSLPFADSLFDRWDRATDLGFGEGSSVFDSVVVMGDVEVGADVWVGPFSVLDGSGAVLVIGDGCDISAGVHIYTHDTARRCVSGGTLATDFGSVTLGEMTYVGSQAVVAPGTVVGAHCVIGANSFVNAPVPDRTIVAGTPARPIGQVEGVGAEVRFVYWRD